jgi:hypothetical protein
MDAVSRTRNRQQARPCVTEQITIEIDDHPRPAPGVRRRRQHRQTCRRDRRQTTQ